MISEREKGRERLVISDRETEREISDRERERVINDREREGDREISNF